MKKNKKKKVSYAWPTILTLAAMILWYTFETGTGFTRLICLYVGATMLFPLTITYSLNLINNSIAKPKKGYTKNKKKVTSQ